MAEGNKSSGKEKRVKNWWKRGQEDPWGSEIPTEYADFHDATIDEISPPGLQGKLTKVKSSYPGLNRESFSRAQDGYIKPLTGGVKDD